MSGTPEYEIPIDAGRRPSQPHGRHRCPVKVKRILVPTDLTNENHRAIEFGLALAKGCCEMARYLSALAGIRRSLFKVASSRKRSWS
jgi:hypothetical protein